MSQIFDYLIWIPVVIAAFYLGMPLLIRAQQKFPARPKLENLRFDDLDDETSQFLIKKTEALIKLGFAEPILVQIPDQAPNVTAYIVMLVHRAAGDKAMVSVLVSTGVSEIKSSYVEFSTSYASGEMIDTSNSATLNAFPPSPKSVRTQTPSVTKTSELYRLHQYMMAQHEPSTEKVVFESGTELEYIREAVFNEMYQKQVERGSLYYNANEDAYRLTMKGAYLITWGLLPPFKWIREASLRRREASILREFRSSKA